MLGVLFLLVTAAQAQTPLYPNVPVQGTVERFAFSYYSYVCSQQNYIDFTVTDSTGQTQLYVALDSVPSLSNYGWANITSGSVQTIVITNPRDGTYQVGVYGYSQSNYIIYAGNQGMLTLPDGVQTAGQVANAAFVYYHFYAPQNIYMMELVCNRVGASGDPDQYLSWNSVPTVAISDYKNTTSSINSCILLNKPKQGDWYYGVYGYTGPVQYMTELIFNGAGTCGLQSVPGEQRITLKPETTPEQAELIKQALIQHAMITSDEVIKKDD